MWEDKLLLFKLKQGSAEAMQRIYEKYKHDMLALAVSLVHDRPLAEDALHDVFVALTKYASSIKLRTNLRTYLSCCIANRVRSLKRSEPASVESFNSAEIDHPRCVGPEQQVMSAELLERIDMAIAQLPYTQREVILLHVQGSMTFKAIAHMQGVSVNTIQSRYRYGLDKLRQLLNVEVKI